MPKKLENMSIAELEDEYTRRTKAALIKSIRGVEKETASESRAAVKAVVAGTFGLQLRGYDSKYVFDSRSFEGSPLHPRLVHYVNMVDQDIFSTLVEEACGDLLDPEFRQLKAITLRKEFEKVVKRAMNERINEALRSYGKTQVRIRLDRKADEIL